MAQSRAGKDRENVTAALKQHGFDEAGIASILIVEEEIARRAKARKPVEQTALDFGDWA